MSKEVTVAYSFREAREVTFTVPNHVQVADMSEAEIQDLMHERAGLRFSDDEELHVDWAEEDDQ